MRGVTAPSFCRSHRGIFLLTRLMRGVTDFGQGFAEGREISTHTPHARRDRVNGFIRHYKTISTHTPHARRDRLFARRRIW